jgi:PAS domain S-box-containing protein
MCVKDEDKRLREVALSNAQSILRARQRAEDELRRQTEWLRVTLAGIGDAVISTDAEGRVTFMNGVAEKLTGWTQADALGRLLPEVFHIINELTHEPVENPALRALHEGTIVGLANHTILIARDGTERPVDDSAAPIRDESGKSLGAVLVFRDVTERKRAEIVQAHLAALVESSQDAIVSKTLDGVIRSWNKGAEQIFGYSAEEAVGQPINLIIPPDRQDEEHEILARIARGKLVKHFETVRMTKQGRLVDISLTISPIRDALGRIIGASKVGRDISDRKQAEEMLREADKRKDQFIALLAHELRNPLAPLRNGLQVIRMAASDPHAVAQARDVMERQLTHMVRLVDDLLDISRISQNKMELRRSRLLFEDVMSSAVETAMPAIEAGGHKLAISLPPEPVHLDGDLTRLAQVFSNLLTNSAKYTEREGHIWIAAEVHEGELVVTVRDTGIGIPAESLPRIFDMFSQVDRRVERETGGLGIGLALVKGLVEMHGGSISATSEGQGHGSLFTVRLPVLQQMTEGAALATVDIGVTPATKPRRRILVVDDNRDSGNTMSTLLKIMGNEVRTAYGGNEALEIAETFQPQAILMDIGMPQLNGYDATQCIRKQPWGRDMIIIALTGWGQDQDRIQSREAGCDGHMVKPVNVSELEKLLQELEDRSS